MMHVYNEMMMMKKEEEEKKKLSTYQSVQTLQQSYKLRLISP